MTTFDDKRIAEIRAYCVDATPAPWFAHDYTGAPGGPPRPDDVTVSCDHPAELTVCYMRGAFKAGSIQHELTQARADANFIALARTALPEALDEIERLRKALETSHRACGAPVMFWGGLGQALEHHPNCCLYGHEIWP